MNKLIPILFAVLLVGLLMVGGCGIAAVGIGYAVLSKPATVQPVKPVRPATDEGRVWSAMADRVQRVPTQYPDTDAVFAVAKRLQESGDLSSTDRLSGLKVENKPITEQNRGDVIRTLRGGGQ